MWEYRVIPRRRELDERTLLTIGKEGWEMCGVTKEELCAVPFTYYFKRPYEKGNNGSRGVSVVGGSADGKRG